MTTRRRLGVGAAGASLLVAVLVLTTISIASAGARPDPTDSADPPAVAGRGASEPVLLAATELAQLTVPPLPTTTTTPPPPPVPLCPVAGPVSFTDSWGDARAGHRHEGVDMMAAAGTPIVAPVDGVVSDRRNGAGGLTFHLLAADGTDYYGAHLSSYEASGAVTAGTVLGYVGTTGNAESPHLHFEIHPTGEAGPAISPAPIVAEWCGVTL